MKPGGNSGVVFAAAILGIVLGTLAVALRLYTRKVVLNQLWVDDYLAVVAWVGLMAMVVQNFVNIGSGLGSHMADIPADVMTLFYKHLWLGLVIYNIVLVFTKLTVFFQFYRVIRQTNWRGLKMFYISVMSLIAAWQVSQVFIQVCACTPVALNWDKTITEGHCLPIAVTRVMNSAANIVTDFIILLLPLPVIWRLRLPHKQKWALLGIFSLGFFTCIISILRITTSPENESDLSWQNVYVMAWTTSELTVGIVVAAMSTMRPLISRYFPSWTSKANLSSYRLDEMPSPRTAGVMSTTTVGRSGARSSTMRATSARLNGGGWLDLSDEGIEEVEKYEGRTVKSPEPAYLEKGLGRQNKGIMVTKEWTVQS